MSDEHAAIHGLLLVHEALVTANGGGANKHGEVARHPCHKGRPAVCVFSQQVSSIAVYLPYLSLAQICFRSERSQADKAALAGGKGQTALQDLVSHSAHELHLVQHG